MDNLHLHSALSANIYVLKIAQRDYEKAQVEADKWERRYQLCLKEGRDNLVKEARFRKDVYIQKAQNLKAMLGEQTERLAKLRLDVPVCKPLEEVGRIKVSPQALTDLPVNDLITRLDNVETELEAMKAQLVDQHVVIGKLIKQNSNALENVKNILWEATEEIPEPSDVNSLSILEITKFNNEVNNELELLEDQLLLLGISKNSIQSPIDSELEHLRLQLDNL